MGNGPDGAGPSDGGNRMGDREPWAGRPRRRADRHGDSPTRSPFGGGEMRGIVLGFGFIVFCFLFSVMGWETAQTELGPPMGGFCDSGVAATSAGRGL